MKRAVLILALAAVLVVAVVAVAACGGTTGSTSSTAAPATSSTAGSNTTASAPDDAASSTAAANGAAFKVGLAGPMTGQNANYGESLKEGAQIAIDELNAAGGVNGGQASFVLGDDLGDPKQAVLVAQQFIDDKSVLFVDGHMFSGATLAAGPKYETAGMPMISPSATNADISTLGKYIWRICMTDAVQGKGLADYTVKDLALKNVGIMFDDSDYGRGLADAYATEVAAAGGTVVDKEQYTGGDAEFKAQLTKIKAANPQMIFLSGYFSDGAKVVAQAKELGITAQFLGSDGYASDQLSKLGGAAVEGMLVSTFFDYTKQDDAVQKFVTAFKAKYNANPDYFAANSYDLIMLAASVAKAQGTNSRQAIEDGLNKLDEYKGISGTIKFDANGDVLKPLSLVVVQNGQLVTAPKQPSE